MDMLPIISTQPLPIAASSQTPANSPFMPRLNQTLQSLHTHQTEFVPTDTCTIFKPLVGSLPLACDGALTSNHDSPARFSLVTPERTIACPLQSTAHTNPVGPTLSCDNSQVGGVEMVVQRRPSGAEAEAPLRNIAFEIKKLGIICFR